jgi:hypothetical protein
MKITRPPATAARRGSARGGRTRATSCAPVPRSWFASWILSSRQTFHVDRGGHGRLVGSPQSHPLRTPLHPAAACASLPAIVMLGGRSSSAARARPDSTIIDVSTPCSHPPGHSTACWSASRSSSRDITHPPSRERAPAIRCRSRGVRRCLRSPRRGREFVRRSAATPRSRPAPPRGLASP